MLLLIIAGCEILFWVLVLGGLTLRYILRKPAAGKIMLYCTPLVDLILLVTTVIHLKNGAEVTLYHGLAAVYIGISIGFGKQMIGWADVRFAQRFAGGPPPVKVYGKEHARQARIGWLRHLLAWCIGCALLGGIHLLVQDYARTATLLGVAARWAVVLFIDFLISFSYTLWPRRAG